jgi:hypothetical protein
MHGSYDHQARRWYGNREESFAAVCFNNPRFSGAKPFVELFGQRVVAIGRLSFYQPLSAAGHVRDKDRGTPFCALHVQLAEKR